MVPEVVGSNPTTHLYLRVKDFAAGYSCRESQYILGCSQVVRHQTLTLAFRRFEPCQPSLFHLIYWDIAKLVRHRILIPAFRRFESFYPSLIYGPLAQMVEHLTFNQVVRGSNPRCLIEGEFKAMGFELFHVLILQ